MKTYLDKNEAPEAIPCSPVYDDKTFDTRTRNTRVSKSFKIKHGSQIADTHNYEIN